MINKYIFKTCQTGTIQQLGAMVNFARSKIGIENFFFLLAKLTNVYLFKIFPLLPMTIERINYIYLLVEEKK